MFSTKAKYEDEADNDSDLESEDGSVDLTDEHKKEGDAKMNVLKAGLLEECKLVLLVRQDLKMDKGKIAAQCRWVSCGARE